MTDLCSYVACLQMLKSRGHHPHLLHADETSLACLIHKQSQIGLALDKDQIATEALKLALVRKPGHDLTKHWVKSGQAGVKWVKKFLKRWSWLLSERKCDPRDHQRRLVTWPQVTFFDILEEWAKKYGATVMADGTRVMEKWQLFNMDETCIATAPKAKPVICTKGQAKASTIAPLRRCSRTYAVLRIANT